MTRFLQTADPANSHQGRQAFSGRRKLLFSLIVLLLAVVAIELGLQFLYSVRGKIPGFYQKAARISPYANLDWPRELFFEEERTQPQFVPYVMWRRQEFHGKHINISAEGLRKTWNPPLAENQPVKKVFCFGGSTTWGVGARDDFTVPSLLAKKLNQGTTRYVVRNYGEKGYTLTQEIMTLVLLLKQGNIPDYVIFYDGINEVMVGYKNGEPGSIFGAKDIRRQLFRREKESVWRKIDKEWRHTGIYRAAKDLSALVRPKKEEKGFSPEEEKAISRLADAIAEDYLKNIEVVKRLAQAYGFKYLCLWQPSLCTNKALTPEEKNLDAWDNKKMVRMYELVYDRMSGVRLDHFHNISTMFDQKKQTLFLSWAHVTEKGNEQVAQRIFQIFQQEFLAGSRS